MDTLGVYRVIDATSQLVGHLSMSDGSFAYDSSGQKAKGIAEGMASEIISRVMFSVPRRLSFVACIKYAS